MVCLVQPLEKPNHGQGITRVMPYSGIKSCGFRSQISDGIDGFELFREASAKWYRVMDFAALRFDCDLANYLVRFIPPSEF